MPKVIKELRERILAVSREKLTGEGYDALTMRSVAEACGIAAGTVYNYFPSKDVLAANVMLEDWLAALARMREGACEATDAMEGLERIYREIAAFAGLYAHAWSQYRIQPGSAGFYRERHRQLTEQLAGLIGGLLARTGAWSCEELPEFLAENLLAASMREDGYERMRPVLRRILRGGDEDI